MSRSALLVFLAVLCASPVLAQATRLERDVEFVRKLATELRFISLAQSEVENLQRTHRDSRDFKLISQLNIEISLIGARSHPNREEQRTLFKDALDKSKDFIVATDGEPVADQARLTMVQACHEYGSFLLDEIEIAREGDPELVKELEERAADVYRDGVDACDKAMETFRPFKDDEDSPKRFDYFRCWLYKGILLRENARAVKQDRDHLALMARESLEELIFEVGEESGLGLKAFFEMSKIGEVQDNLDRALADYKDVISSIQTSLRDVKGELGLSESTKEFLFNLMQEAYDRAGETLFLQGKIDDILALGQEFRERLTEFGEQGLDPFEIAHPTFGHSLFLVEARAMAESGNPEQVQKALPLTQRINDAHPSDIIGIKAKTALKDILDMQSQAINGKLLFEVAKGDYQAREYETAIKGLKRAYAAMTRDEQKQLGLELWTMIGRAFGLQERYLEAALALCKALEDYGADEANSPESTANTLFAAWQGFNRDTKSDDDPAIGPLRDRISSLLGRFGGESSQAKLRYREGNRLFGEGKFAEAALAYSEVPADTPYFDPAQGRVVAALQAAGDHDKARAAIAAYERWLETPAARIPDDRREPMVVRQQTLATMVFFAAYMDYREATGLVTDKTDSTRYAGIIQKLQAFLAEHGQYGSNYVPRTYDMIARLWANLGETAKAEENYRTLRNLDANSPLVPQLATQIFKTHNDTVKALAVEHTALVDKGADQPKVRSVKDRLDTARRQGLNCGLDYMRNSPEPQYGVLWNTLMLAYDLRDWANVEEVGQRIIQDYGPSPEEGEKVLKFVKPLVGESYLERKDFRNAVPILQDVVDKVPADYPTKRLLALALGGWFELDSKATPVWVLGMDKPIEAYEIYWKEYQKYALNPGRGVEKYGYDWYRFHFECFCFAKRAAKFDSKFARTADTFYSIAKSFDEFKTLRNLSPEGEKLFHLFQEAQRSR